jgi:hypothetical protein
MEVGRFCFLGACSVAFVDSLLAYIINKPCSPAPSFARHRLTFFRATTTTHLPQPPHSSGHFLLFTNALAKHLSLRFYVESIFTMTTETSHGRGGAGNFNVDDTKYVDGEVVRSGVEGSHGDGAYSSGRGGKLIPFQLLHTPETATSSPAATSSSGSFHPSWAARNKSSRRASSEARRSSCRVLIIDGAYDAAGLLPLKLARFPVCWWHILARPLATIHPISFPCNGKS